MIHLMNCPVPLQPDLWIRKKMTTDLRMTPYICGHFNIIRKAYWVLGIYAKPAGNSRPCPNTREDLGAEELAGQ